jgi:hypothetical protein
MYRLALLLCLVNILPAEIIDKVAIIVGREVITELQLDEEIRVTAFLNHQPVVRDANTRRDAADRLVQQLLVKREMELSRYPLPTESDIDEYLAQVREDFGGAEPFAHALTESQLSESTLREHLALQLTTLRFIEFRFRPDISVSETDIQHQYQREIENWNSDHPGVPPPSLASSRESIRKTLIEQRMDEILATWLEESRKQLNIVYLDKSLQ